MSEPNIPNVPPSFSGDQSKFLLAVKSAVELLMGSGMKSTSSRAARYFELSATKNTLTDSIKNKTPLPSGDIPDPPTNLVVDSSYPFVHVLTWDNPSDPIVSHIEIWAAVNSEDRGTAKLIGIVTVTEYLRGKQGIFKNSGFAVTDDYTYWIRSVSYGAKYSVWCPPDTQGGYVVPGTDSVQDTIDALLNVLNGKITEDELYQGLSSRIDLIDGPDTLAGSVAARVKTEAQARADAIIQEQRDRAAAISTEQTSRVDADDALSRDITTLTTTVNGNVSDIANEQTARAGADSAMAGDITTLFTKTGDNETAISNEQTARTDADSSLAQDITTLFTITGNNTSAISTEQTARADGDSALASDIETLTTATGDNAAAISTEQTARADGDSALSTSIGTVQTTVDGHTTSIETNTTSINGIEGKYSVKIDNNGYVTGFGMISTANNGTPTSEFIILTDKFKIVTPGDTPKIPFSVGEIDGNSTVGINGNLVLDGSIAASAIQTHSITSDRIDVSNAFVGMTLQSSNFVDGSSGWQITGTGGAKFYNGQFVIGYEDVTEPKPPVDADKTSDIVSNLAYKDVVSIAELDPLLVVNGKIRADVLQSNVLLIGDADLTGSHTANDTYKVNGVSAATVQANAANAEAAANNQSSDGIFSVQEKAAWRVQWPGMLASYNQVMSQAQTYGISGQDQVPFFNLDTYESSLYDYLNSTHQIWATTPIDTPIYNNDLANKTQAFYDAMQTAMNKLADFAHTAHGISDFADKTNDAIVNGHTLIAGGYINTGLLDVTTAAIHDLAVSTLKIKDQAVTIPVSAFNPNVTSMSTDGEYTAVEAPIFVTGGIPIFITCSISFTGIGDGELRLRLFRGTSVIYSTTGYLREAIQTFNIVDVPTSGFYTYSLKATLYYDDGEMFNRSIMLLATKK